MSKRSSLLCLGSGNAAVFCSDGRYASIDFPKSGSAKETAQILNEFLQEHRCLGGKLIFGIDSRQIYFLETDFNHPAVQTSAAVKFAVEPQVPVDAEDMAVLVVSPALQQRTLVWDMSHTSGVLEMLNEEYGITFDAFVPAELVWLQHLQSQESVAGEHYMLKLAANSTERFRLDGKQLVGWDYTASFQPELVDQCQNVVLDESVDSEAFVGSVEDGSMSWRKDALVHALPNKNRKMEDLRYNFSECLPESIVKNQSPWQAVLIATLFSLLGIAAALWFQSVELSKQSAKSEASATALFRELFPNRRIKGAVDRQLETELKRQQQINSLVSHSETSATVLENLRNFLRASKSIAPLRFQFDSLRLGKESIAVTGRVKGFDEFQKLKQGFIDEGFSIGPSTRYGDPFALVVVRNAESIGLVPETSDVQVARKSQ